MWACIQNQESEECEKNKVERDLLFVLVPAHHHRVEGVALVWEACTQDLLV